MNFMVWMKRWYIPSTIRFCKGSELDLDPVDAIDTVNEQNENEDEGDLIEH